MNKRKTVIALSVFSALWTAFIFFNSLQSSVTSNGATYAVLGWIEPILKALSSVLGEADWFFLIRKAAHMAEFCVLGVSVRCLTYILAPLAKRPLAAHTALYVLCVAVTDEFIQFYSLRTSAVYDVLIDFSGALIGMTVVAVIRQLRLRYKRKAEV